MARRPNEGGSDREIKDNETNLLTEEHLQAAISTFLARPVQTYDQFMDSFIYLTKEDVKAYNPESGENPEYNCPGGDLGTRTPGTGNDSGPCSQSGVSSCTERSHRNHSMGGEGRGIEDLETEELTEGVNSLTMPHKTLPQRKHVKVDTYLDEPDFSDSDPDDPSVDDITDLLSNACTANEPRLFVKLTKNLRERVQDENGPVNDEEAIVQGQVLFPGEADTTAEFLTSETATTETRLAVGSSNTDGEAPAESPEQQTDEVQPFALDPDFDYDNVKLTPKWDNIQGMLGNGPVLDPT